MDGFIPKVGTGKLVTAIRPTTWNKLADTANSGRMSQTAPPATQSGGWPPVYVINKTGAAIAAPYRAFSLGGAQWEIGSNRLAECVFELAEYDSAKPLAVIQQPLAIDEVGLAVVSGPTLVEVSEDGTSSDRAGSPDADGIIIPGDGSAIRFTQPRPEDGGLVLGLIGLSGGSVIKYFVLAEDAVISPVKAYTALMAGDGTITSSNSELFDLYFWVNALSSPKMAKAGYGGVYTIDDAGRPVFVNGPCITGCQTDSEVSVNAAASGTVGVSFSLSGTVSGAGGNVSATSLPPGVSISNPSNGNFSLSGTPTTAGVYIVELTVSSDDDPPCTLTKIVTITINPST